MSFSVNASLEDINACQFFEWYPIFQKNTIKSVVLDLNEEFIAYLKEDGIVLPDSVNNYLNKDELSDEEELIPSKEREKKTKRSFTELEVQIQNIIDEFGGEVFIKMNWSAPIDAVWMNNGSLKCCNLHDIYLLLKSSDRIVFDLENMYNLCSERNEEKKAPKRFTLVIRKWANLQPSMEFRLYIRNHVFIGLCQRDCTTFFHYLPSSIDGIAEKLKHFYVNSVKGLLTLQNYVLDVYIDKKDRVWVVDVNPFGEPTSSLLFEWEELLQLEDFSIRIVENEKEKLSSSLGMSRGPIDVHLAPDFQNFLDICKKQAREEDTKSDDNSSHDDS